MSEDVDVAGVQTTYGVDDWAQHYTAATATAPAVARAVAAGARGSCKVAVQTAGLDLVGPAFGNVTNKARVSGGGATGAAVAVAQGTVAFALAPDTAGEVRNPAACAGVCAYRPSPGVLGGARGDSAGNSVAGNMCVLAADPGYLLRVAQVLGAPGKHRHTHMPTRHALTLLTTMTRTRSFIHTQPNEAVPHSYAGP